MNVLLKGRMALANMGHMVGALSHKLKGRRFDSLSGHMPGLRVLSPGWGAYVRQPIDVSRPLSFPLSLKSVSMSLGEN